MMPRMDTLIALENATHDLLAVEDRRRRLIREAIAEGKRLTDVATAAGTSPQRMTQIRRELGMAPRPAGRPRRPAQP